MPVLADTAGRLRQVLRCPKCRAPVSIASHAVTCEVCRYVWSLPPQGYVDLRLPTWNSTASRWHHRQQETCAYYEQLKRSPSEAIVGFQSDLGPFAATLQHYRGSVLDVGGGNGIARAFLPSTCEYVSL